MNAPFFIVGASRSGTTLLRLLLNAHPRLAVPDELKFFKMAEGRTDPTAWSRPLREGARAALIDRFCTLHASKYESMEAVRAALEGHEALTLQSFYALVGAAWAREQQKPRWGEKTPHNLFYADVLTAMFPSAVLLHVVRDPRAVVHSMNTIAYYAHDPVLNALNWRQAIQEGIHRMQGVPSSRVMTLRYEDLVADPEAVLRDVCDRLGEAFDPAMLAFHRTTERYMGGPIRTPAIQQPVNERSLEKWRTGLSRDAVAQVEAICAVEMARWGYAPTGARESVRARAERLLKTAYWQGKHHQHRNRRGYEVNYAMLGRTRERIRRWRSSHATAPMLES
ncbi:sulfotransferase family protein [Salisaeta longa]|uniref:sulfotransferase family protein n=1 Tax=Salisaeta longa TaxID=503170 RepID=UPI0003B72B97|nr:sulfotransferase [Salisaeta longa]